MPKATTSRCYACTTAYALLSRLCNVCGVRWKPPPPSALIGGGFFYKVLSMPTLLSCWHPLLSLGSSCGVGPRQGRCVAGLLPRRHHRPGCWDQASLRPQRLAPQGLHQGHPALTQHAHLPQAGRPLWSGHARAVPLQPARLVLWKPCALQARSPYHAASLASGGRSVRTSHGSFYPSSHRASRGPSTCRPAFCKAVPRPRPRVPGWGTKLCKGRQRGDPAGRKGHPVLMRTNGCQPRRTIRRNRQEAYTPIRMKR
jgi:hypothetical protein